MRETYLVQRLEKPRSQGMFKDNPFSFGGGFRNGGLSAEAMDALRPIFGFDYMGAAEYEFGELPKSIGRLAKNGGEDLKVGRISLEESQVAKADVFSRVGGKLVKTQQPLAYTSVYYICRAEQEKEVIARILEDAKGKLDIKNGYQQFARTLRSNPKADYPDDTIGWYELDNDFFYFVSREAWEKTALLFGIEV